MTTVVLVSPTTAWWVAACVCIPALLALTFVARPIWWPSLRRNLWPVVGVLGLVAIVLMGAYLIWDTVHNGTSW